MLELFVLVAKEAAKLHLSKAAQLSSSALPPSALAYLSAWPEESAQMPVAPAAVVAEALELEALAAFVELAVAAELEAGTRCLVEAVVAGLEEPPR